MSRPASPAAGGSPPCHSMPPRDRTPPRRLGSPEGRAIGSPHSRGSPRRTSPRRASPRRASPRRASPLPASAPGPGTAPDQGVAGLRLPWWAQGPVLGMASPHRRAALARRIWRAGSGAQGSPSEAQQTMGTDAEPWREPLEGRLSDITQQASPAPAIGPISRLLQPTPSAGPFSRPRQPAPSAGSISRVHQPAGRLAPTGPPRPGARAGEGPDRMASSRPPGRPPGRWPRLQPGLRPRT